MRSRSKKMEKLYAGPDGRRAFVARILKERRDCEACHRIEAARDAGELGHLKPTAIPVCGRRSVDVHEILSRSAGGDILDDANVLAVCRAGHDWIGKFPREATALGLRRSRYGK